MAPVEAHLKRSDSMTNWNKDKIKKGDSKTITIYQNESVSLARAYVRCDCRDDFGQASIVNFNSKVKGRFFENLEDEGRDIILPTREPLKFSGQQRIEIVKEGTSPKDPEVKLTLKHYIAQEQELPRIGIEQVIREVSKLVPADPRLVPAGKITR